MNSEAQWGQSAQQFQHMLSEGWGKALQAFQQLGVPSLPTAAAAPMPQISFDAEKLQALQQQYVKEATDLWNASLSGTPETRDRRFAGEAWGGNPLASFTAAVYLLNSRSLAGLAEAVQADDKTRARIRFAVEQ